MYGYVPCLDLVRQYEASMNIKNCLMSQKKNILQEMNENGKPKLWPPLSNHTCVTNKRCWKSEIAFEFQPF